MKTISAVSCLMLASGLANAGVDRLNLDIEQITVSGLSSGGYMAGQFHIAHANWVSGAGLLAAGPYYCARNSILTALGQCVNKQDEEIPLPELETQLQDWRQQGLADPAGGLKGDRVWLLHGTGDMKVIGAVTDKLARQYESWLDDSALVYIDDQPFSHHFPTLNKGSDCSKSESPFIGNCGYDAAGQMMAHIAPYPSRPAENKGELLTLDQRKLGGEAASGLAEEAFLYAPAACLEGQSCKLHVSFHGCNQNVEAIGTDYARLTGLNEWADTHNTVVLYPQTKQSSLMPLNPQGCWDWWGYTNELYATKQGPQIQAVSNMITRLAEK